MWEVLRLDLRRVVRGATDPTLGGRRPEDRTSEKTPRRWFDLSAREPQRAAKPVEHGARAGRVFFARPPVQRVQVSMMKDDIAGWGLVKEGLCTKPLSTGFTTMLAHDSHLTFTAITYGCGSLGLQLGSLQDTIDPTP